ncbi:glycosyl hydrolase family 28 protein [Bacteroidota bacterium]
MKYSSLFIVIFYFFLFSCQREHNELIVYDAPESLGNSKFFNVTVNKRPLSVYDTKVEWDAFDLESEKSDPDSASFVYFDFSGKVEVEIEPLGIDIREVIVRPLSKGIIPRIEGKAVSFSLDKPQKLSIEINGNSTRNLMLFADEIEISKPDSTDENVLYFGPGIHEIEDEYGFLRLNSNQTLYLAGGAILRARIIVEDARNVTITGRGILDGSYLKGRFPVYARELMGEPMDIERPGLVNFKNTNHVEMSGIIVMDAPMWTTTFNSCTDVLVRDTKTICYVINSDGINLVNTQNAVIEDVFVRSGDDCIAIKGLHGSKNRADVANVRVRNSTLWADQASAIEIGHETSMNEIKDVHFLNIDILEQRFKTLGYHAMDITHADSAYIHDIYFDDIRVERCLRLLGIRINESRWMSSEERGIVENIYFKNITTFDDHGVYLYGYDSQSPVKNIIFEDFYHGSEPFNPLTSLKMNNFVFDLKYAQNGEIIDSISRLLDEGIRFQTIDISKYCNRTRTDEFQGDQKGWFDLGKSNDYSQLKGGEYFLGNIPFQIPKEKVIMLGSDSNLTYLPGKSEEIPINQSARYLFFLQTTTFNTSDVGKELWTYKVNYKNGRTEHFPVLSLIDVADWRLWSLAGWQFTLDDRRVYIMVIENQENDFIESIEIISKSENEIPVILAVTAGL